MKLITFDMEKNVTFFGECKLQLNTIENCLKFTKLDKVPEETMMTSSFDRFYIRKNNLLSCFDQESNYAFIGVFPNNENCEQIYDAIAIVKSHQPQSSINEDEAFKDQFFIPLIKQVQAGIDGFQDLKDVILNFVNSLDVDEKLAYFNILADIALVPTMVLHDENNSNHTALPSAINSKNVKIPATEINAPVQPNDLHPFICQECGARYKSRPGLTYHRLHVHGITR